MLVSPTKYSGYREDRVVRYDCRVTIQWTISALGWGSWAHLQVKYGDGDYQTIHSMRIDSGSQTSTTGALIYRGLAQGWDTMKFRVHVPESGKTEEYSGISVIATVDNTV